MPEEAAQLRRHMRALRSAYPEARQAADAAGAAARILALDAYAGARVVMAYVAARGELPLDPVLDAVLASGRTLALPRCEGPGVMTARRVRGAEELQPGAYGIREPGGGCERILPGEIDLVLVPGTAFDPHGGRIGQGGGYYDRFLPGTRAVRVGVCHDFALLGRVPVRAHDARMDWVVTPSAAYDARRADRT